MKLLKQRIEKVFRVSSSNDDLFDAFRHAIDSKIDDPEFYKILLWNKALSSDEIIMFAEKICAEFPDCSFDIYMYVGQLFSSISFYGKHNNKAFKYFLKAAQTNPADYTPYASILSIYSNDIDIPPFEKITAAVVKGIDKVDVKSKLCFGLMKLYSKKGLHSKAKTYQKLGESYQQEGK